MVVSAVTGGVSIVFSILEFELELVGVAVALALDALVIAANCDALVAAADANCEEDILRVFLGGISVSSFLLLLLLLFLLVSLLFSLLPAPAPVVLTGIRIELDGAAAAL